MPCEDAAQLWRKSFYSWKHLARVLGGALFVQTCSCSCRYLILEHSRSSLFFAVLVRQLGFIFADETISNFKSILYTVL